MSDSLSELASEYLKNAKSLEMQIESAKAKLPGVSLDNTIYNILESNIISNNYGGGIKMVRTGVRNLIIENVLDKLTDISCLHREKVQKAIAGLFSRTYRYRIIEEDE